MGLFGGMNEDELRVSGTPASARVTYSDDTGKRRDDGARARVKLQLKIDSGSTRGRELEQTKWVPADRIPRVGETVQIRIDPDDLDDWAWGDAAMYAPMRPVAGPTTTPAATPVAGAAPGMHPMPGPDAGIGEWMKFAQNAMSAWPASNIDPDQLEQMMQMAMQQGNYSVQHYSVGPDGQTQSWSHAGAVPPPGGAPVDDTATRLRKIDELHQQGLIDAAERERLRQKIIDSI